VTSYRVWQDYQGQFHIRPFNRILGFWEEGMRFWIADLDERFRIIDRWLKMTHAEVEMVVASLRGDAAQ